MRRLACWLVFACGLTLTYAERPDWCHPGYICLKREDAEALDIKLINLETQLVIANSKIRRWGFAVGPGVGVSGIVTDDWNVKWVPSAGGYMLWGFYF